MVFTERRSFQRRSIRRQAKIIMVGSPPRNCLVMNISDGGVRLYVEGAEVPERFVLLLSDGDGHPQPRDCKVAWRLGFELGAEFLDAAAHRRANQPAAALRNEARGS